MKKLTKITFTVTAEEAEALSKAIAFFDVACTKVVPENTEALGVTAAQLEKLMGFKEWITEEISDLDAWNAEVEHFENIAASSIQ